MEFSKVMEERRSVRHYNDKKLDRKTIVDILNYGIMAPSAHNRQPWHFIVVEDQAKKENIANVLEHSSDDPVIVTCNVIKECSALVLVFADITDEIMDIQSVGACIFRFGRGFYRP